MKPSRSFLAVLVLLAALGTGNPATARAALYYSSPAVRAGEKYLRTELYFGLGKKDGTELSDAEWDEFLADEVTPRFPDGFTVVFAVGQFRDASGKVIRERSRMLIVLYRKRDRVAAGSRLEAIRVAYKARFSQDSVLRVDVSRPVKVCL